MSLQTDIAGYVEADLGTQPQPPSWPNGDPPPGLTPAQWAELWRRFVEMITHLWPTATISKPTAPTPPPPG